MRTQPACARHYAVQQPQQGPTHCPASSVPLCSLPGGPAPAQLPNCPLAHPVPSRGAGSDAASPWVCALPLSCSRLFLVLCFCSFPSVFPPGQPCAHAAEGLAVTPPTRCLPAGQRSVRSGVRCGRRQPPGWTRRSRQSCLKGCSQAPTVTSTTSRSSSMKRRVQHGPLFAASCMVPLPSSFFHRFNRCSKLLHSQLQGPVIACRSQRHQSLRTSKAAACR